jgi:Ca-activated chloride channel family protein
MNTLDDLKLGTVLVIREEADSSPLPLEDTAVSGEIVGAIAYITVTQRFGNPFKMPIELEYLFPLPHTAAVMDYEITIGARTIKANIKEIEAAQRAYRQAVNEGKRASLLEQRRPNLFSIRVGNVQPGESIITKLRYEERLKYDDNAYEFVFPMGITPRYHAPSEPAEVAKATDAPLALDENKVAPVSLDLTVDAGVNVMNTVSRTHKIDLIQKRDHQFGVKLVGRNIPNKDFVLRYEVAQDAVQTAVWNSQDEDADTAVITILPPRLDLTAEPLPREFIFVIDRSGSMMGAPIQQAKNALQACLRALGSGDTFMILAFDDKLDWMAGEAYPVTQINVEAAETWLAQIDARGGTEIMPAINSALLTPADKERLRYVVFLTDGAVSADEKAIRSIAQQRGTARIFTFGIGPSVNRFLLDKMAQMGRGIAEFLGVHDDIEKALTRFQDRVSYPALLDVALTWENAEPWDTYPETLPDLYAGQPLEIVTRYKRQGAVRLTLNGKVANQPFSMTLPLQPATTTNPALKRLHARARIEALLDQQRAGGDAEKIRQQVISLALEHRIITPFTAFVAIDSEVASTEQAEQIRVSVPLPEGLDLAGFVGAAPGSGSGANTGASFASMAGGVRHRMAALPPAAPMKRMVSRQQLPDKDEDGTVEMLRSPQWGTARMASAEPDFAAMSDEELGNWVSEVTAQDSRFHSQQSIMPPPKISKALQELSQRQSGEQEREIAKPAAKPISIEESLKILARTQNINGSWQDHIEMTAAAVLAFVRAGHTTRSGDYRRQVSKAMLWLFSQLNTPGFALFVAVRALDELQAASGDGVIPDEIRQKMPKPSSDIERAAAGDTSLSVPTSITTLDDVRIVALLQGNPTVPTALLPGKDADLARMWQAVGKPK